MWMTSNAPSMRQCGSLPHLVAEATALLMTVKCRSEEVRCFPAALGSPEHCTNNQCTPNGIDGGSPSFTSTYHWAAWRLAMLCHLGSRPTPRFYRDRRKVLGSLINYKAIDMRVLSACPLRCFKEIPGVDRYSSR